MPKFLEDKLKKEYGAKSAIPYKVMNSMGEMRGNKETPKGARMEAKHIEHVHEHLNTDHLHGETHKGVDKHGEKHTGHVAGTLPAHKHEKVTHHYEKG
jgi:hypothetical protein